MNLYRIVSAYCMLSIWNPDQLNWLKEPKRSQKRLYFKTMGIVYHDRVLNTKE